MAYIINNAGSWRPIDNSRPWYQQAFKLMPELAKLDVLEVGSGAGEMAKYINSSANSYVGVDISPAYITRFKKLGFQAVRADLNKKLPFLKNRFSMVIALEVIEHVVEAEKLIAEINRVLKRRGYFLLSTPNIAWWGYRLMALTGNPPKKEGYHFRFFNESKLASILHESGFEIVNSAHFSTIPWLNKILIKLKVKPLYPVIKIWPNLLAQDLVWLCRKK